MRLHYRDAINLINKAAERMADDKMFFRWVTNHEHIDYKAFKAQLMAGSKVDNKTEAEIFANVSSIIDTFNKGVR
jgi:hypothetical protein